MAQDDIQGQVVDAQGNPVDGAIVELTKSYQSNPADEQVVLRTTTDSNGEYRFFYHPDGDGTTQEWHVSAYNHDGTAYVNSFYNPGLTAELRSNAIPDSAIHQWEYGEGSGTTVTDNIGDISGSISGASWISDSESQGGYRLSFDGIDDRVSYTLDISQYSEWMYCFTIETTSSLAEEHPAFSWDESEAYGEIRVDDDPITLNVGDGSELIECASSSNVYDGSKHRIACYVLENDEIGIAVDGTVEDTVSFGTMGPITSDLFSAYLARTGDYAELDKDHPVIYTDSSQQTIDGDYNAQPWT